MNKNAFTLIEALVAVAILTIGFAGVYSLVLSSLQALEKSVDREKLAFQSTEMIESMEYDKNNITSYQTENLVDCENIKPLQGKEKQMNLIKGWCKKMASEVGSVRQNKNRKISVEKKNSIIGDGEVYVLTIDISGKEEEGNNIYIRKVVHAN